MARTCMYCGGSYSMGFNCVSSPTGKHVLREQSSRTCIYCGGSYNMTGHCQHSPNGKHSMGVQ